tara:strand:- start:856 stop:1662 length:807 start_codon:yes stop_codon:yes gene_type:complete
MSFTQWVLDVVDWNDPRLTDRERGLRYLQRHPDESLSSTLTYLFKHYPNALGERNLCQLLKQMIQELEDPEELYRSLDAETLEDQAIVSILSLGAPILFWKYFNPAGKRVHHKYLRGLYMSLDHKQRVTYAVAALSLDGELLQYLAPEHITLELCMLAVKNEGYALRHVPKKKRTNEIVEAAISRSASAMEYASKKQRIKFIELAVLGSGQKLEHHRIGGFSSDDWNRTWAKEVFKAIGKAHRNKLYQRWVEQRQNDEDAWHNDYASR